MENSLQVLDPTRNFTRTLLGKTDFVLGKALLLSQRRAARLAHVSIVGIDYLYLAKKTYFYPWP